MLSAGITTLVSHATGQRIAIAAGRVQPVQVLSVIVPLFFVVGIATRTVYVNALVAIRPLGWHRTTCGGSWAMSLQLEWSRWGGASAAPEISAPA
jgi:hypothetical protein